MGTDTRGSKASINSYHLVLVSGLCFFNLHWLRLEIAWTPHLYLSNHFSSVFRLTHTAEHY